MKNIGMASEKLYRNTLICFLKKKVFYLQPVFFFFVITCLATTAHSLTTTMISPQQSLTVIKNKLIKPPMRKWT